MLNNACQIFYRQGATSYLAWNADLAKVTTVMTKLLAFFCNLQWKILLLIYRVGLMIENEAACKQFTILFFLNPELKKTAFILKWLEWLLHSNITIQNQTNYLSLSNWRNEQILLPFSQCKKNKKRSCTNSVRETMS